MISAKEAREIVEQSAKNIEDYIEREFSKQIQETSERGFREYIKDLGSIRTSGSIVVTKMQEEVLKKLTELGYIASISRYGDTYVPLALQDDYGGNGPLYVNFGFIVRW